MRNKPLSYFVHSSVLALSASLAGYSMALTVRDDVTVAGSENLANQVQYDGVVQIYMWSNFGGIFYNCTGSLMNHRTVISAAHCFNSRASNRYGVNRSDGDYTPIIAYGPDTDMALGQWISNGLSLEHFQVDRRNGVTFGSQVFLHPDGDIQAGGLSFPGADVAMIALQDPLDNLPSYALMFSPVTTGTHVSQVAYGGHGIGSTGDVGIDGKRQAGENIIGLIGSQNDFLRGAFRSPGAGVISGKDADQILYHIDFDRPDRDESECSRGQVYLGPNDLTCSPGPTSSLITADSTSVTQVNDSIDWFPGDALDNESGTAGGDSGSAIFFDKITENKLIIGGVLSGGWFFTAPQGSGYGDTSYYQPLFLFHQWIAENNPYKYVSVKAGDGNWSDKSRWVQTLDPGYLTLDADGKAVNALPVGVEPGVEGGQARRDGVVFDINITADELNLGGNSASQNASGAGAGAEGWMAIDKSDLLFSEKLKSGNIDLLSFSSVQLEGGWVTLTKADQLYAEKNNIKIVDQNSEQARTTADVFAVSNDSETPEVAGNINTQSTVVDGLVASAGPNDSARVNTISQGEVPPVTAAGGPGSTDFVPNNTDRGENSIAQYFEVTLAAAGKTTVDIDVVIDKLTLDHSDAILWLPENKTFRAIVDTQIAQGTLQVDGQFTSRDILNGGILTGSGVIHTETLFNSGTLMPREGLKVKGDVVFTSAGTLIYQGYALTVEGDVSLNGQLGVKDLSFGNKGTALNYNGDKLGTFTAATIPGVRKIELSYNTGQVDFEITTEAFSSFLNSQPLSKNSSQMASYLDSMRGSHFGSLKNIYDSLDFLPANQLALAVQQLVPTASFQQASLNSAAAETVVSHLSRRTAAIVSGNANGIAVHISGQNNLAYNGQGANLEGLVQQVAETGLASGDENSQHNWGMFGEISYSKGDQAAGIGRVKSDVSGKSVTLGFDADYNASTRLGAFINYTEGSSDFKAGLGSSDSQGHSLGVYGLRVLAKVNVSGYVGIGRRDLDTLRASALGGALRGSTKADEFMAGIAASRMLTFSSQPGLALEPEARLDYNRYDIGAYTERGALAALNISKRNLSSLRLKLGGDIHIYNDQFAMPDGVYLSLGARLVYDLYDERDQVSATFVAGSASPILVQGAARDEAWGEIKLGLNFGKSEQRFSGALYIEETIGRSDLSYRTLGLNVKFKF